MHFFDVFQFLFFTLTNFSIYFSNFFSAFYSNFLKNTHSHRCPVRINWIQGSEKLNWGKIKVKYNKKGEKLYKNILTIHTKLTRVERTLASIIIPANLLECWACEFKWVGLVCLAYFSLSLPLYMYMHRFSCVYAFTIPDKRVFYFFSSFSSSDAMVVARRSRSCLLFISSIHKTESDNTIVYASGFFFLHGVVWSLLERTHQHFFAVTEKLYSHKCIVINCVFFGGI
jgi:hypothetical protein